jgi:hypothetical protein
METSLIEDTKTAGVLTESANTGYDNRRKKFINKKCEMYGRLHCDVFNIDKYLLNNMNIHIELHKADDEFCLLGTTGFKVEISDLYFNVRKVRISPEVILAQAMALEKGNAKYPLTRVVVEAKSIKKGMINETFENVARGPIPKRLIIGLVATQSYTGSISKNPFNFQNFKLAEINLSIDGEQIPYQPLKFDFQNNQFIMGYYSLVNNTDANIIKSGNDINLEDYQNGYILFCFDLSPDSCLADHNLDRYGNLRVSFNFKEELNNNVSVIFYHEYNSLLEINKLREVKYDLVG